MTAAPARPRRPGATNGLPALAVCHALWALACALMAMGASWIDGRMQGLLIVGILVMVIPGVLGLFLLVRGGWRDRLMLVLAWSLAALATSILAGGVTGPLGAFAAMPIAAGLALGGVRLTIVGGVGTMIAIVGGLISSMVGQVETMPTMSALSALIAAVSLTGAMTLSGRERERRLAEAEDAANRVEALLVRQPGMTMVFRPDGYPLAAYGAAPPGIDVDGLFAEGLMASIHAPDRGPVLAAMARAEAGSEVQIDFTPRTALDRRTGLSLRGLEDGMLAGHLRDATMQFAREQGLMAAKAEAERQDAGKTRFLANMSHELRTPLNAVLGFADIMRQRLFGPLPDRYAGYADSIHEAGGHLLRLINDVLDLSKIEAERYVLSTERFDAREVVSTAMALVRLSADEKALALNAVMPNEPLMVRADRRAMTQIALNLLSNAVKFTPERGAVTVTAEAVGPYLELIVADTGVGIAPEDLKRLGKPFEQAGGVEQRAQGTGLGLSLVRSLAELHGGRMSVESTLGEGTAVTVRLPVADLDRAPPPEGGAEIIPIPVEQRH